MANQPMDVTGVISRAFSTWFDHFVGFFVLALLLTAPMIPMELLPVLATDPEGMASTTQAAGGMLRAVAGFLLTGVVVIAVFQSLKGKPRPLTESLRSVLPRLPWIAIASIAIPIFIGIGLVMCIIPGIYLWLALVVVVPVIVVEQANIVDAVRRSWELTKGQKLQIFLVYLMYGILLLVVWGCATGVTLSFFGGAQLDAVEAAESATTGQIVGATVVDYVTDAIIMPLQATLTTVVYHDLRRIHDELTTEEMFPMPDAAAEPEYSAPTDGQTDGGPETDGWDDIGDTGDTETESSNDDDDDSWGRRPSDDDEPVW